LKHIILFVGSVAVLMGDSFLLSTISYQKPATGKLMAK